MHIYISCTGNPYATKEHLSLDDIYCELCGWDTYLGYVETREDALKLLDEDGFSEECINDFMEEYFDG